MMNIEHCFMRIRTTLGVMALSGFLGGTAFAHHSYAAFDQKKTVWIEGTVSEIQYTNPHAWVFVDVANAAGGTETWAIETGGPNHLIRSGWMKNTVKAGDKVKVLFNPMRDSDKKAGSLKQIVLSDGRALSGF